MIAISSPAPFSRSAEVAENQRRAKVSWDRVFSEVIYFSPKVESALASASTTFVLGEEFPRIKRLAQEATCQAEWTAIVNADIVVGPGLARAEKALIRVGAQSAISYRWQVPDNAVVDNGLDFFAATPALWKAIATRVPDDLRLGHCYWDTWMLAAFTNSFRFGTPGDCYDLTPWRIVFHPKHGDRIRPHTVRTDAAIVRQIRQPKLLRERADIKL